METTVSGVITLNVRTKKLLADTVTPVSLYLKIRDCYRESVLLESNDFRSKEDCHSFIGMEPIAQFIVQDGFIVEKLPNGVLLRRKAEKVPDALWQFLQRFQVASDQEGSNFNGVLGHTGFDGVQYFDTLHFDPAKRRFDVPDMRYSLYRFIIAIDHFKDEMVILENIPPGEVSKMEALEKIIESQRFATHPFRLQGEEQSNLTDEAFMELVRIGKRHCYLGDVFQIVFSRQFSQKFQGDDFNVYRVLRSVNPSPYLFYFDCGDYHIFGSSPEAQMVVKDGVASVNPIAGTYRRSGDKEEDAIRALDLMADPKENAEHIMLVDLARNDLSRHATNVRVKELKDIQFFSHVIHLVSKVQGDLVPGVNPIQVFADTFPAGTLSGAPKYKALQLIDQYENQNRSFYGGALGYIAFNGDMNQAIVIRSFLSKDNTLFYQSGAGVVAASVEEKELQEVNNKLGALKKALLAAQDIKGF
jgi:anthranilate synthase component 1